MLFHCLFHVRLGNTFIKKKRIKNKILDVEKENPRAKRFSENNEYMALETGRYRNRIVDLQNAYIQGQVVERAKF